MKENGKLEALALKNKLWSNNSNSQWLASTISLYRNLEKFKFPGKLGSDRGKQIISFASKEILGLDSLNKPLLIKAEDLTALDKEYLIEHFLSNQGFQHASAGEAFIIDEGGEFLVTLNMRDHIHYLIVDIKGELENAWNRLVKIESIAGKGMSYSYSPKYGFLTADLTQCGTALHATVFLQPSALIHMAQIDNVLEKLSDDSLMITGIQGSPTEIIGDVIAAQNNYTLGLTEENIISTLRVFSTNLLVEEHAARNKLRNKQMPEIKDKVSRAYGILIHSYQIEAVEALNAISLLKLGADLEWISGISIEKLNELFFLCRRAHLLYQFNEKIPQEEIQHRRAEYIHSALKDVKLNI